jgi:hypothetical protein
MGPGESRPGTGRLPATRPLGLRDAVITELGSLPEFRCPLACTSTASDLAGVTTTTARSSARAHPALRHRPRRAPVPQRERQPDPALHLLARLARGTRDSADARTARDSPAAPAVRPAPLRGYLAAELPRPADRGRCLGRPQRRGADARVRPLRVGPGRSLDHPHGCLAPPARQRPATRPRAPSGKAPGR